jgi:hypothetical protein
MVWVDENVEFLTGCIGTLTQVSSGIANAKVTYFTSIAHLYSVLQAFCAAPDQ